MVLGLRSLRLFANNFCCNTQTSSNSGPRNKSMHTSCRYYSDLIPCILPRLWYFKTKYTMPFHTIYKEFQRYFLKINQLNLHSPKIITCEVHSPKHAIASRAIYQGVLKEWSIVFPSKEGANLNFSKICWRDILRKNRLHIIIHIEHFGKSHLVLNK